MYRDRVANIGWMFCRRDLGWNGTSELQDVCHYLDGSQNSVNVPVVGTPYYIVSTSAQDGVGGTGVRSLRVNCLVGAAGATIKLSAIPGAQAAGNRCEGSFHFLLIQN